MPKALNMRVFCDLFCSFFIKNTVFCAVSQSVPKPWTYAEKNTEPKNIQYIECDEKARGKKSIESARIKSAQLATLKRA